MRHAGDMAAPLHNPDALRAVAESPPLGPEGGGARDWALTGLALAAAPASLPQHPAYAWVALLAGVDSPEAQLVARLPGDPSAAHLVQVGLSLGTLDPASEPLREALRQACRVGEAGSRAAAGRALLYSEALEPSDLRVLAEALRGTPFEHQLLPAFALAAAPEDQLPSVASAVSAALVPRGTLAIRAVSEALGLPTLPGPTPPAPEAAIARVASRLQVSLPLPPLQGSRRRRAQKAVAWLLDGLPGPSAALIRAIFVERLPPDGDTLSSAALLHIQHHHPRPEPLDRALLQGDTRPLTLYSARQSLSPSQLPELQSAIQADPPLRSALPLLCSTRLGDASGLAPAGLDLLLKEPVDRPQPLAMGRLFAARAPERLVGYLRAHETRPIALRLAPFSPSTPVLAALLELPLPADPSDQQAYALALASMGDRSTRPLLRAMQDQCRADLRDARRLTEDLLGPEAW